MSWWFSRRGVPSIPRSQSRWRAMSEGNQGSASSDALRKPLLHCSSWRAMSYSVPLFLSDDALIGLLDTFYMTYAILETCTCGLASPLIGVRGSLSLPAGYPWNERGGSPGPMCLRFESVDQTTTGYGGS